MEHWREIVIAASQRVLALRQQHAGLRRQYEASSAQLAEAERELDRLLVGGAKTVVAEGGALRVPQGTINGFAVEDPSASIAQRAIESLEVVYPNLLTITDIAARLEITNLDSLRSILGRLASEGRIEREARGHFRARRPASPRPVRTVADLMAAGRK